jgi:hypothetical protein
MNPHAISFYETGQPYCRRCGVTLDSDVALADLPTCPICATCGRILGSFRVAHDPDACARNREARWITPAVAGPPDAIRHSGRGREADLKSVGRV